MRASTYWNAYKKILTLYLIAGLENNCDDMAHYIKTMERIDNRLTAEIERMELLERQGEIDG